ncbi:hypothetical protein VNO78_15579 [Psophocarpus tetragonolobus]|uniref:Glycosyltransferase n=1 Tax=Psophocarpus tetragonolobus TaxID=3891 RepID=A0AAN9XJA9_PSOTE
MNSQPRKQLHVTFLPYPTPGHMNPMIDTARLFAKYGTLTSVLDSTTHVIPFPAAKVGLPDGVENIKDGTTIEKLGKIMHGISMLKDQIELQFQDLQPDCIVSDMMYPWTVESAAKLGIPRIFFYSSSYFSNCVSHSIRKHRPHESFVSNTHKFTIPGLSQTIEMTTLQLPEHLRTKTPMTTHFDAMFESESASYGALYNSFHELESEYKKLHGSMLGIKSWTVGPVSAWVNKDEQKANRERKEDLPEEAEWLKWLNSKKNESVLYVSFGSLTRLSDAQLVELAIGLEDSGHSFIWVARKRDGNENVDIFLKDFAKRMKENNKGYIIRNWAPQLLILDHPAIGGIVTHCGWNSILESLNAGLPMVTWPMFAEQFYNEKFLVDVLKIGVPVGAKENMFWASIGKDALVIRKEITNAVVKLMGKEESTEMRRRARELGDASKKTIEEGGSSYNNLMQLLDELRSLKVSKVLSGKRLDI